MTVASLSERVGRRRETAIGVLRTAVSATDLLRTRAGFGWTVRPAPGSVLASARIAAWDPEPDYFHHWVRDAAVVMRVVPDILEDAPPEEGRWWRRAFADYVAFSLAISDPDGAPVSANPLRQGTAEDHLQFLRPDAELRALRGAARLGEPRVAADGTPDPERWSRPQYDGPALRASGCLAICDRLPDLRTGQVETLVRRDLAYTAQVAGAACIGPWEEAPAARHSFTLIAQWDALMRGAHWSGLPEAERALMQRQAGVAMAKLEALSDPESGAWRQSSASAPGVFDSATLLAILHAGRSDGPLAKTAPATQATVSVLEAQFGTLYPLNARGGAVAFGRWKDDAFFGGNPWLPITLGCAELHYEIAAETDDASAFERAEAWMALVLDHTSDAIPFPEQMDRVTGTPVSCLALSWSAAAFIGAAAARARAVRRGAVPGAAPDAGR